MPVTPALVDALMAFRRIGSYPLAFLNHESTVYLHTGTLSAAIMVENTLDVPVCVSGRDLANALCKVKGDQVDMFLVGSHLAIRQKDEDLCWLMAQDEDPRFWSSPFLKPNSSSVSLSAADLVTALRCAASSMSSEETRLYVNGVYFDHGTPEHPSASSYLTLVATDGRRLTHATFPCPVPTSLPRFIMPSDAVKVILDLLKRRTKHVVLESDGKVFQVTGPDWRVWGPTISNAFPDWRCILPKSDNRLSVDCSAFVTALSPMVKSFKNSNNRHSEKLRVALAKDCIRLKTCDSRDMRATVPANGSQLTSEAIFSVNARHLLDTLKALQVPKCGRVTILPYLESWIVRILADDTDRAGLVVANSS